MEDSQDVEMNFDEIEVGNTWQHAILEIYEPKEGWPKDGTPAHWIANNTVGWCDGRKEDVVVLCPLRRILWWKAKNTYENVYWWVRYYIWDWWHKSDWDKFFGEECPVLDTKENENGTSG